MLKRRLERLEQHTPIEPLVIVRTRYGGGRVTGYQLGNGEQLTIQPNETGEAFSARARTAAKVLGRPVSIIRAAYGDSQCQH